MGGFAKPSRANKHTFAHAIDEVASAMRLFEAPVKTPPPRDREVEAERTRAANCFGAA